ncbi:MAG: hypothetical protein PHP01_07290 [Phycisphaerae bacterium]|nr:hypothetical protein [Phycisphaerae bacterium]
MNAIGSLKEEWNIYKRNRFQRHLVKNGWEAVKHFKHSTLFQKGTMQIEVDAWGAFLFEFKAINGGSWLRTHGIDDGRIDDIFSIGHNSNILPFKDGRKVKRLDLSAAAWVR